MHVHKARSAERRRLTALLERGVGLDRHPELRRRRIANQRLFDEERADRCLRPHSPHPRTDRCLGNVLSRRRPALLDGSPGAPDARRDMLPATRSRVR